MGSAKAATMVGGYLVEELISRGERMEIYAATRYRDGQRVALKRLRDDVDDPAAVAALLWQARSTAIAAHPLVVRVLDIGRSAASKPFYAMELIHGPSLADVVSAGLRQNDALALSVKLTEAVVALHGLGVAHRRISPAHVMVADAPYGQPSTCCKLLVPAVPPRATPRVPLPATGDDSRYLAPEQRDFVGDCRSDSFALGLVLSALWKAAGAAAPSALQALIDACADEDPRARPTARKLRRVAADAHYRATAADDAARCRQSSVRVKRPHGAREKAANG